MKHLLFWSVLGLLTIVSTQSFAIDYSKEYRKNTYRSNSDGKLYVICRDKDGFRVKKPGGSGVDAHGAGYKWKDIKVQYGIPASANNTHSVKGNGNCKF